MAVISNSSPLILYARVGRLDLLPALFDEVIIPVAVYDEVVAAAQGRVGAGAVAAAPWITVRALAFPNRMPQALASLDRGEAEALALALELDDHPPVLLDDRRGRRTAAQLGITVYGSAGVLLLAKERGMVAAVHPLLAHLQRTGLYLNDRTRQHLLRLAGEPRDG